MSALLAIALVVLAGLYVALPGLRGGVDELPHDLDRLLLEGELAADAAALREWAKAAGELEVAEETASNEGEGA